MRKRLTAAEVLTELRRDACGLGDDNEDAPFLRGYVDATREAIDLIEANLLPPADDAEPITEEWLLSHQFESRSINGYSRLLDCDSGFVVELYVDHDGGVVLEQEDDLIALTCTPPIRTRGDLRRLWHALAGKELS